MAFRLAATFFFQTLSTVIITTALCGSCGRGIHTDPLADGGLPDDPNSIPLDQLCKRVNEAMCANMVKRWPGTTLEDCDKMFSSGYADCDIPLRHPEWLIYDGAKAKECLVSMSLLPRGSYLNWDGICESIFTGTRQAGESCARHADCAGDLECVAETNSDCLGKCQAMAQESQKCNLTPCRSDLFCDDQEVCRNYSGQGYSCGWDYNGNLNGICFSWERHNGLYCQFYPGEDYGYCQSRGVQFDPCNQDNECEPAFHCVANNCVLKPKSGEPCTYEQNIDKDSACLYDKLEYCRYDADTNKDRCLSRPAQNISCGGQSGAYFCDVLSHLKCSNTSSGGICVPGGQTGDPCNPNFRGWDCVSGVCASDAHCLDCANE